MRRILPFLLGLFLFVGFLATLGFLWWKSRDVPVTYAIEKAEIADVVEKTVATGAINPRVEVAIKSRVSGVVSRLAVEPGQIVRAGDLIGEIRVIPDVAALEQAQSAVQAARIGLDDAKRQLERGEQLAGTAAIAGRELDDLRTAYALAQQEYESAQRQLQIVREGATRQTADVSTQVRSTVDGMVLSVDVEAGQSVIESNTFNEGTTIATVADMNDLVFEGQVDESEVGRLKEGMPLEITVGALENRTFAGTLEYISPKGVLEEGAVQFEIKARVEPPDDVFIRAGSSANADIVLDRRDDVLTVEERLVGFDEDGKPYVEVAVGDQQFERRSVELGLSDGIRAEVLAGIDANTELKGREIDPNDPDGRMSGGGRRRR